MEKEEINNVWKRSIFEALKDLADIDMQKKAWLGLDENNVSSYSEIINILYDDSSFKEYIENYKGLKGNDNLYEHLLELDKMLNDYKQKEDDAMILIDPKWISITKKAQEIISIIKI
jgi:hypothetical protein